MPTNALFNVKTVDLVEDLVSCNLMRNLCNALLRTNCESLVAKYDMPQQIATDIGKICRVSSDTLSELFLHHKASGCLADLKFKRVLNKGEYTCKNFWHVDGFANKAQKEGTQNYRLMHYSPFTGANTLFMVGTCEKPPRHDADVETVSLDKYHVAHYDNRNLHKCAKMENTVSRLLIRLCEVPDKDERNELYKKRKKSLRGISF